MITGSDEMTPEVYDIQMDRKAEMWMEAQEQKEERVKAQKKTAEKGRGYDVMDLMAFEDGSMDEDDVVVLFQKLIDCGDAWRLQGFYGRTAMALIEAGLCHR